MTEIKVLQNVKGHNRLVPGYSASFTALLPISKNISAYFISVYHIGLPFSQDACSISQAIRTELSGHFIFHKQSKLFYKLSGLGCQAIFFFTSNPNYFTSNLTLTRAFGLQSINH